jgi:putative oxidoreductase
MLIPQLQHLADVSFLLLRFMVGIVFLASGWNHLKDPEGRSKSIGMSKGFTVFLGVAELAGSLGVILGVLPQLAIGLILLMLGAIQKKIFVWHTGFWGKPGYGWHYGPHARPDVPGDCVNRRRKLRIANVICEIETHIRARCCGAVPPGAEAPSSREPNECRPQRPAPPEIFRSAFDVILQPAFASPSPPLKHLPRAWRWSTCVPRDRQRCRCDRRKTGLARGGPPLLQLQLLV